MVPSANEDLPTAPEPLVRGKLSMPSTSMAGLVILSCPEAPERVGAFMAVSSGADSTPRIFGRGPARAEDEYVRVQAVMQRPGLNAPLPPFQNVALSRVQLQIAKIGTSLDLLNVGMCPVSTNGQAIHRATVGAGDVIEVGRQLALLCVERPQVIVGDDSQVTYPFGEADEHGIVGESVATHELRQKIRFVSMRTGHVLIVGASGTGKELVAAAIHRLSRPEQPWVARNAGTFPDSLLDSELYGNAKGYPNVGTPERKGLIGAADRGSLFLDEFAELPMAAQTHLLRVLDAGEYQRLGEPTTRSSNFRLIAATNRALSDIRPDVLARFSFRIDMPTLGARREDIPLLARHWLRSLANEDSSIAPRFFEKNGEPRLTTEFVAALMRFPLEGNVRELRNLLWEAVSQSRGSTLTLASIQSASPTQTPPLEPEFTAAQLQNALEANGGSIEKTWRTLGLSSRFALMRLMKKSAVQIQRSAKRG